MSNFLLAFNNQADDATLSAGSWEADLPLNNLKDYRVQKVARSTDALAASTKLRIALAAPSFICALALINTNASLAATVRWQIFTDNTYTTAQYDSGTLDVWPGGTAPSGSMPFGAPNWWTQKPTAVEIARWQQNIIHVLATFQYGQYIECQITDTANADGYIQAGRLFVGEALQPAKNASYGAALQLRSRSTPQESRDGTPYWDALRPAFSIPFAFDHLTANEGMKALELQAVADLYGEVLMLWDHSDPGFRYRKSIFGRLAKLDPLAHPLYSTYRTAFQVEGIL